MRRRIFLSALSASLLPIPAWAQVALPDPTYEAATEVGIVDAAMPLGIFEVCTTRRDGQKRFTNYSYEGNFPVAPELGEAEVIFGARLDRIYVMGQLHWERTA